MDRGTLGIIIVMGALAVWAVVSKRKERDSPGRAGVVFIRVRPPPSRILRNIFVLAGLAGLAWWVWWTSPRARSTEILAVKACPRDGGGRISGFECSPRIVVIAAPVALRLPVALGLDRGGAFLRRP